MARKKPKKLLSEKNSTNSKGDVVSTSQTDNLGSGDGVEKRAEKRHTRCNSSG